MTAPARPVPAQTVPDMTVPDMTPEDLTRVLSGTTPLVVAQQRFLQCAIAREIEHRVATLAETETLTTAEAAERIARELEQIAILWRPFDRTRVTIAMHGIEARGDTMGQALVAWVTARLAALS